MQKTPSQLIDIKYKVISGSRLAWATFEKELWSKIMAAIELGPLIYTAVMALAKQLNTPPDKFMPGDPQTNLCPQANLCLGIPRQTYVPRQIDICGSPDTCVFQNNYKASYTVDGVEQDTISFLFCRTTSSV